MRIWANARGGGGGVRRCECEINELLVVAKIEKKGMVDGMFLSYLLA